MEPDQYALKKNQKTARVVIDAIENSIRFTNDKNEYVLEGAEQIGEVLVFQNVNCYYMLYAYALKKNQKAARVVIDAIENSIRFTNDKK